MTLEELAVLDINDGQILFTRPISPIRHLVQVDTLLSGLFIVPMALSVDLDVEPLWVFKEGLPEELHDLLLGDLARVLNLLQVAVEPVTASRYLGPVKVTLSREVGLLLFERIDECLFDGLYLSIGRIPILKLVF